MGLSVSAPQPWATTDEDGQTGFLLGAEHLSEGEAVAEFLRQIKAEFGWEINTEIEPLAGVLLPFREPREDDYGYGDAIVVRCDEDEEPTERVWVFEELDLS